MARMIRMSQVQKAAACVMAPAMGPMVRLVLRERRSLESALVSDLRDLEVEKGQLGAETLGTIAGEVV